MEKFNKNRFTASVKNIKEQVVNVNFNSQSKFLICQAAKDNNFSAQEVYAYLDSLLRKHYPDYTERFDNRNWKQVYKRYIKAESDLAPKLQEILTRPEANERKNNDYLREQFFSSIRELGEDPNTMQIDMSIDLFGWMTTLDLILGMVADESIGKTSVETPTVPAAFTPAATTPSAPLSPVTDDKCTKTRTRVRYASITQYTLDREFVHSWKNIAEICRTHPEYNHSSISKCLSGKYKTAENFIWEGVLEEEMQTAA